MPISSFILVVLLALLVLLIFDYAVTKSRKRLVHHNDDIKYFEDGKARIRPVLGGRFVAEIRRYPLSPEWFGVDLTRPGKYFWSRWSSEYHDCIGTYDQCFAALGASGVSAEPKTN